MPDQYYKDALRRAQREFRSCTAHGQYPYLPVLDQIVPAERLTSGSYLGECQIPMEFVVGTRTSGRTHAFARNFMPLVEDGSEFSDKWKRLCQAHLEEGIRDPLKVYEYLNRYYVEEGNKRVSVLKFFGAETVYARVTRILPERNGSPEVELYYELVDFYRYSRVNFLEFSKAGSYVQLQRLLGKAPEEPWSEDERRAFATAYFYFRQAYEANGGRRLTSTVGDAMLAYIKVYGYQDLCNKNAAEIKRSVARVWEEITLQQENPAIDVKLDPQQEKGEGLLSLARVLPKSEPKPLKVAFIHDKTPELSGWTRGHELGRLHVGRVFGSALETKAYCNALDGDPQAVLEQAIQEGNTVLFTTSPQLLPASLRAAVDHPKVTILNCSLGQSHRYIRTYYARMYEVKFIAGALAGSLAAGNDVGYVCDYPIFGQIAGINAFALGVQMANPRARVYLEWSGVDSVKQAVGRLTARGIRLISSQDLARRADQENNSFGLSLVNEEGQVNLARPVWKWGAYYEAMLRRIRDKSFQSEYEESSKALNYFWGLSAGVVDLVCSDKLPDSTRKLAALLAESIRAGSCQPFQGPIYGQDRRCLVARDSCLLPEQIIHIDWLNENIVGAIPAYDQLTDTGKGTVKMVGVTPATPEAGAKEAAP